MPLFPMRPINAKLTNLIRTAKSFGMNDLEAALTHHLKFSLGKYIHNVQTLDMFDALSLSLRDHLVARYNESQERIYEQKKKRVYYLSMEFLIGRLLHSTLLNTQMLDRARSTAHELGFDLDTIIAAEEDPALGNGGLGRLAACFLDSMASLKLPCYGAGLCYEFGLFRQIIEGGVQKEAPDQWLSRNYPWLYLRADLSYNIGFYGETRREGLHVEWKPAETVIAEASDILVPGYANDFVTHLRLWKALPGSEFNLDYFNHGDYLRALEDKIRSETISKVLYPNESTAMGYELRLKQEYFLVSATLQDALRRFFLEETDIEKLPERVFFQLNDTHPALAVPELFRLLHDVHGVSSDKAWSITERSIAYTNHTVMPEALERWNLDLFGRLLPRHLEIVYDLNFQFLKTLRAKGVSESAISQLSIIEESNPKKVRMANLAITGASHLNGVSALHSELLKTDVFPEFYQIMPQKFSNKTNGITFRRWLKQANPELANLISSAIGDSWLRDAMNLRELEKFSANDDFQKKWNTIRQANKNTLANIIQTRANVVVVAESLYDSQVKRMHEYKRQLLNLLRIVFDYSEMREGRLPDYEPRTFIFSGKAAPGYLKAKLIIRLIHAVAKVVNADHKTNKRLRVAFIPNFNVSIAERIYAASDLSEQISTAGLEASGTGNMKFMLNGAVTIGTLDGANVEINEALEGKNIFIFGNSVQGIRKIKAEGYNPVELYQNTPQIKTVLDMIKGNYFSHAEPGIFEEIVRSLTYDGDTYFLLADFLSYIDAQAQVNAAYKNRSKWTQMSIMNTARSGIFSSDRTVSEYAAEIWKTSAIKH